MPKHLTDLPKEDVAAINKGGNETETLIEKEWSWNNAIRMAKCPNMYNALCKLVKINTRYCNDYDTLLFKEKVAR